MREKIDSSKCSEEKSRRSHHALDHRANDEEFGGRARACALQNLDLRGKPEQKPAGKLRLISWKTAVCILGPRTIAVGEGAHKEERKQKQKGKGGEHESFCIEWSDRIWAILLLPT